MICLIAGNFLEAKRWADGQHLKSEEWFYPAGIDDLMKRKNFHVLVIGTAGQNTPPDYFDLIFNTAKRRGDTR
jgi:hypothetical protein